MKQFCTLMLIAVALAMLFDQPEFEFWETPDPQEAAREYARGLLREEARLSCTGADILVFEDVGDDVMLSCISEDSLGRTNHKVIIMEP